MTAKGLALSLMIPAALVVCTDKARAQAASAMDEIPPIFKQCRSWPVVPGNERGKKVQIFLYWFGLDGDRYNPGKEHPGRGWVPNDRGGYEPKDGTFKTTTDVATVVGIVSPFDEGKMGSAFIMPFGQSLDFYPDPRSMAHFPAQTGRLLPWSRRSADGADSAWRRIECVKGYSDEHLEEFDGFDRPGRGGTVWLDGGPPPDADAGLSLKDRLKSFFGDTPRPPAGIPESGSPSSLGDLFPKDKKGPAKGPKIADEFPEKPDALRPGIESTPLAPAKPGAITPGPPLDVTKDSGVTGLKDVMGPKGPPSSLKDLSAPGVVCDASNGRALNVAGDVKLASLQTVGVRNDSAAASGFEFLVSGDTLSIDKKVDIADSASKLVPYDAVATARSGAASTLWVSIAGVDESRGKRSDAPAAPERTLRVIVFAGATELAMSGLEQIDGALKSGGSIGLDIEWQLIDSAGSLKPAGRYPSFGALVKAAAEKASDRPDVLNEGELMKLFDEFEGVLKTRTVDKVFWVKGAYIIPSSIPHRFEKFLTNVSESSAVPHTPAGRAGKWLQIVTARMPGFSIAYLKEPVNSLQIGDVAEEGAGAVAGPRRLIAADDAAVLATKLRTGLSASPTPAKPGGEAAADPGGLAGKLVFDSREVFEQRGYVFTADSALALQDHLQHVLKLWDGAGVKADILGEFATRTAKSRPTLIDILQLADDKAYPRLPKTLAEWARKPVKDLNQDDTDRAKAFVSAFASGADRLVDKARKLAATPGANCGLFYVSDSNLGIEKP
jgi:hypothetical protein